MRRPGQSFSAMVGASHIRWAREGSAPLLASAHEGDVKLWDTRNPAAPLSFQLSAHLARLHSLDWSQTGRTLVTASTDCTVKAATNHNLINCTQTSMQTFFTILTFLRTVPSELRPNRGL